MKKIIATLSLVTVAALTSCGGMSEVKPDEWLKKVEEAEKLEIPQWSKLVASGVVDAGATGKMESTSDYYVTIAWDKGVPEFKFVTEDIFIVSALTTISLTGMTFLTSSVATGIILDTDESDHFYVGGGFKYTTKDTSGETDGKSEIAWNENLAITKFYAVGKTKEGSMTIDLNFNWVK